MSQAKPSKPRRVVIADDESMMRQFLKTILMEDGFVIVGEASTGNEAVKLCRDKRPDLVCLDINMPTMNGIEALQKIRKDQPDLPAIMISGETTKEHVEESIKLGACGFVVKPFNAKLVMERINQALLPPLAVSAEA